MLLAHARSAPDKRIPDATGDQPWHAFSDGAGALREQLVARRCTPAVHDSDRVSGSTCTLPLADEVYLDAAATPRDDLETLAPSVPADVRPRVEDADPSLDADVAAWFDQTSTRAKLSLLGPLTARVPGQTRERVAQSGEVIAYLVNREHGATVEQVADAFGVARGRRLGEGNRNPGAAGLRAR